MRHHQLRDVLVHGSTGALLGTVSLDQLADSVAGELGEVAAHASDRHGTRACRGLH